MQESKQVFTKIISLVKMVENLLCYQGPLIDSMVSDSGKYYLLSDVLPEDKELRQFLQKRKLVGISGFILKIELFCYMCLSMGIMDINSYILVSTGVSPTQTSWFWYCLFFV